MGVFTACDEEIKVNGQESGGINKPNEQGNDIAVSVYIDGVISDILYTNSGLQYKITAPQKPEDITTNPVLEKYFYGWFIDSIYRTPLTNDTVFMSDGAIYGETITACSNSFGYSVDKGVATITSLDNVFSPTVLVIPAYLNSFPVKSIAEDAFKYITTIKSVVICNGIESVNGFRGCNSMTQIFLPNSVTSIGDFAFQNCSLLASITIPNNIESIGDSAFYGCSSLTSITIPNNIESIGDSAFYGCSNLTSITIPNSVTNIGSSAFSCCSSLESITLPFVGSAFNGTTYTHFGYIFGATSYSDNSSYVPSSLKTVIITGGTSIDDYAFYGCSSLENISIPNSIESLGYSAFYGCSSLKSIIIPNSVTSIGSSAFSGCSLLKYNTKSYVKYLGNSDNPYLVVMGVTVNTLQTYALEATAKIICISAFSDCSKLTSITIPNSVTNIGSSAFSCCSSLESITIPNSVTSIGSSAFYGCTALTSITFANPNGWYVSTSSTATSGTNLTLTNASQNATYFKSTYRNYYWKRG